MSTHARHRQLVKLLSEKGEVTLAEATVRLRISEPTARRDFRAMAEAGLARRVHGAIVTPEFALAEPHFDRKQSQARALKARLAEATAALLPDSGSVFIDAGSTCLEVARAVLDRPSLRVFTNSVSILSLAAEARCTLVAIGGEVRGLSLAATGAFAQEWLKALRFDVSVVGASGLEPDTGPSTTELQEAAVKADALKRGRRRILVAHAQKWGRPAAVRFARWEALTDWVTDTVPTPEEKNRLSHAGVRLHPPISR